MISKMLQFCAPMLAIIFLNQAHASSEYDHISNQETEPFLMNGKVLDDSHASWKHYKGAIRKFTSVHDCLMPAERQKELPDILRFDWSRMTDQAKMEVCMFRVFSSINTPEKAKHWFETQGFQNVILETYEVRSDTITRVQAHNKPKITKKIYVSRGWLHGQIMKRAIYNESFSVIWNSEGYLLGVSYSTAAF